MTTKLQGQLAARGLLSAALLNVSPSRPLNSSNTIEACTHGVMDRSRPTMTTMVLSCQPTLKLCKNNGVIHQLRLNQARPSIPFHPRTPKPSISVHIELHHLSAFCNVALSVGSPSARPLSMWNEGLLSNLDKMTKYSSMDYPPWRVSSRLR